MSRVSSSVLSLCLASALPAQGSIVSPAHFATMEGNQSDGASLGGTGNLRYLQIHGDTGGAPRLIRGMTFRRDGLTAAASAAFSVTLNAWMSTAATTSSAPSATFNFNHGADKAQVVNFGVFNFPATTQVRPLPESFAYSIPFGTPFSYGGGGPLAWEIQVVSRTNAAAVTLDAANSASTNPLLTQLTFGTGCKATGRSSPMAITSSSTMSWPNGTGNLNVSGSLAPASASVIVVIGTNSASWSGIPLPLMIPGSDTNASGPCNLYTSMLLTIPSVASATGAVPNNAIPIPATAEFAGASVFSQLWAIDFNASLGIVTSNASASHWVSPWTTVPVGKVSTTNNASATGTVTANSGLVTRFDL